MAKHRYWLNRLHCIILKQYADQLHGTVTLRVHIKDSGTVDTVLVESGPEIFYEEAIIAAKRLKLNLHSRRYTHRV